MAIRENHHNVEEQLPKHGADPSLPNKVGQAPLTSAWRKKSLNWSEYEIDEDCRSKQGNQADSCVVLKRSKEGPPPQRVFLKQYTWGRLQQYRAEDLIENLVREHQILQRLDHPFIVSYLGYQENKHRTKARLYMEYCDGGDLHSRHVKKVEGISRKAEAHPGGEWKSYGSDDEETSEPEPVSLRGEEAWSIVFQLAAALAYLHYGLVVTTENRFSFKRDWDGIKHRDIKPDNVVLKTTKDEHKWVKLCDLGLSTDKAATTRDRGSPRYWPPEVVKNALWTTKGDIFSLGVTLSELWIEPDAGSDLLDLIASCQLEDREARPSSLAILEAARKHTAECQETLSHALHDLLGSGPGNYTYQALMQIAPVFDEDTQFGDDTVLRREGLVKRLKCLYEDGAREDFDKHCDSLHLCVLLDRTDRLRELLLSMSDPNERLPNSGWTPLHLAFQEGKDEVAELLKNHNASLTIRDQYGKLPEDYKREKDVEREIQV